MDDHFTQFQAASDSVLSHTKTLAKDLDKTHYLIKKQLDTLVANVTAQLQRGQEPAQKCIEAIKATQAEQEATAESLRCEQERFEEEKCRFEEERAAFVAAKEEANKTKAMLAQMEAGKVKLDIGGHFFCVSLDTLAKQQSSFFESMFSGHWNVQPGADGTIFVDRDGTLYRDIFNYLRDGDKYVLPTDIRELKMLANEAEFLCLFKLKEKIMKAM